MKTLGVLLVLMQALGEPRGAQALRVSSEVSDGGGGFVILEGEYPATLMLPGEVWHIKLPHPLMSAAPKSLKVKMCYELTADVGDPPSWALSVDTAGPAALTEAFFNTAPVPVEIAARVPRITEFLVQVRHPDAANMAQKLADWVRKAAEKPFRCEGPVDLIAPMPTEGTADYAVRGSHPDYRLVPR